MNRKGQVLVVFILLLPIMLSLISLIVDTGISYMEKRKIEHVVQDTVFYALDHLDEDETSLKINMTNLLNQNLNEVSSMEIEIKSDSVHLKVEKKIKTIFSILTTPDKTILVSYQGSIINGEKSIRKE